MTLANTIWIISVVLLALSLTTIVDYLLYERGKEGKND